MLLYVACGAALLQAITIIGFCSCMQNRVTNTVSENSLCAASLRCSKQNTNGRVCNFF